MNILLLYPEFPDTFWSYRHALSFIGKKAALPPLGLVTVAGLLPAEWNKRLVDMNVERLRDRDLAWADYAFISGMSIQREAAHKLIARCKAAGLKIVAGGPLFTMQPELFESVDHLVLNEAEITLPPFLEDLKAGRARRKYVTGEGEYPPMAVTSVPRWELLKTKHYHSMALQYSRGCPFNCDFCNVTMLLGHRVRTKSTAQILAELDALYANGWKKGNVFFVDDNFIGNKKHLKTDLLPSLIEWRKDKPGITFHTEASIDLADDEVLTELMVKAGFDMVFVGIETPDGDALAECSKKQNERRDLVADVKKLQRAGLQVQGGFIVGFDSDQPSIFRRQIDFIQRSGIVTAMVGLLQAPNGTRLYRRMEAEGRLSGASSGDNVEGTTNIVPLMDMARLREGYKEILNRIYSPRLYYKRVRTLLREYRRPRIVAVMPTRSEFVALLRSFYRLGIFGRERRQYWRLLLWTVSTRPALFPMAVSLAISGYHFRKVCELRVQ